MTTVTAVPLRPLARGSVLKLWIGLAVLVAIAVALAWWGTRGQQVITTASGLRYQVVEEGRGDPMTARDLARVTYVGRTPDGQVFDSTEMHGGQPMVAGVQGMIPGFAEGLLLMREGGTYRLWIPPHLGYNGRVPPGAPFGPNDTLMFDIHVEQIGREMAVLQQLMGRPQGGQPGDVADENARELGAHPANPHAGAEGGNQ
jgi:FKBP-type peptidyl-prolyl cis-trans isomerase FkpA